MKKTILLAILFLLVSCLPVQAQGYDFYFFGVNPKVLKNSDWKMVALGAATSVVVHTAGHYLYAAANDIHVRQDGFKEMISTRENSAREIREFAQAGFVLQHAVGLALTTISATRQTDFTKGYVVAAFAETVSYPILHQQQGDLITSDRYGGDRDLEYIGYMAVATDNLFRIKWY